MFGVISLYNIHDAPLQELLDVFEQPGEEINDGVDAALWDHLYNNLRTADSFNSEDDRRSSKNISALVDVLSVLNDLGRMDTYFVLSDSSKADTICWKNISKTW